MVNTPSPPVVAPHGDDDRDVFVLFVGLFSGIPRWRWRLRNSLALQWSLLRLVSLSLFLLLKGPCTTKSIRNNLLRVRCRRIWWNSCCSWPGDRSGYSWGCRFSSSCWRVYWAWVQSNSPWTLCCSPCCHRVLPDVRWRRWCAVCWVAAGSALWAPATGAGAAAHRGAGSRDLCARSGPRCSCATDGGGTGGRILSEVRRACGCRAGYRCAEDLAGHGSASYGGLFTSDADGGTVGGSADCRDLRSWQTTFRRSSWARMGPSPGAHWSVLLERLYQRHPAGAPGRGIHRQPRAVFKYWATLRCGTWTSLWPCTTSSSSPLRFTVEGTSDSVHRQSVGQRSSWLVVYMPVLCKWQGLGQTVKKNVVPQFWQGGRRPLRASRADSQVQVWRRQSSPTVAAVEKSDEIPHVFLDKVVDMPVIVNDKLMHSGGASIQFIAYFRGHSSCATQTGMMLPAVLLMAATMGFLTHFASFFALLRLCRSWAPVFRALERSQLWVLDGSRGAGVGGSFYSQVTRHRDAN